MESHDSKYIISSKNELLRKAKEINVPVHGAVNLTLMAMCFIDNQYFQRLKHLKQLGMCYFVFPGATHTRFEHSIGTYYLAERIVTRILTASDSCKLKMWLDEIPELENFGLNPWTAELIKIAALCHDVGHGPYSHLFDDVFIKNSKYRDHPMATHESRSCEIVKKIVEESSILSRFVSENDIKFIQSLIDPPKTAKGFVYQIVSNNFNSLDVDKYDYINRDAHHAGIKSGFDFSRLVDSVLVVDNNIVYPEQAERDIYNLFITRHDMHRRVYGHKAVVSTQFIIMNIMTLVDKAIKLTESILDMKKFIKMTDDYVLNYAYTILDLRDNVSNPFKEIFTEKDYNNLEDLVNRIKTHELFTHVGTMLTKERIDLSEEFKEDQYIIFKCKVGFVSGDKSNPLDDIYVYKTKDFFTNGFNVKARHINKSDISHIMPDRHQEHLTIVYRKSRDLKSLQTDREKFQKIRELFYSC